MTGAAAKHSAAARAGSTIVLPPDGKTPQERDAELGYQACGINGCILRDKHAGDCIFQYAEGKRKRDVAKVFTPSLEPLYKRRATSAAAPQPQRPRVKGVHSTGPAALSKQKSGQKRPNQLKAAYSAADEESIKRVSKKQMPITTIAGKLLPTLESVKTKLKT